MAKVTLHHQKGIFTRDEVVRVCEACGVKTTGQPDKGTWTQQEVADLLKGFGHRVFSGDTGGESFTFGARIKEAKQEPEKSGRQRR